MLTIANLYFVENKGWAVLLSGPEAERAELKQSDILVSGAREWRVTAIYPSSVPETIGAGLGGIWPLSPGMELRAYASRMPDEEAARVTERLLSFSVGATAIDVPGYLDWLEKQQPPNPMLRNLARGLLALQIACGQRELAAAVSGKG